MEIYYQLARELYPRHSYIASMEMRRSILRTNNIHPTRKVKSYEEMLPIIVKIIREAYTPSQARDLLAWYESPLGSKTQELSNFVHEQLLMMLTGINHDLDELFEDFMGNMLIALLPLDPSIH